MTIHERLRDIRLAHRMSLKEAGDLLQMDYQNLRKLEVGTQNPSLRMLKRIATFYGITFTILVAGVEYPYDVLDTTCDPTRFTTIMSTYYKYHHPRLETQTQEQKKRGGSRPLVTDKD